MKQGKEPNILDAVPSSVNDGSSQGKSISGDVNDLRFVSNVQDTPDMHFVSTSLSS